MLTTLSSSIAWHWEEEKVYTLTIENGSGSGSYSAGEKVVISADTPPSGQEFASWTGAIDHVDEPESPTATVTMPEQDIVLTATYQSIAVSDPFGDPVIYPTVPMSVLASVSVFGQPARENDVLAVYCGDELRGKSKIVLVDGMAVANLSVYTATDGESLTFKLWNARLEESYESSKIAQSKVGGELGRLDQLFSVSFHADPFGSVTVYPTIPMNIQASVELFGAPAAEGDVVAVYHVSELRGKASVVLIEGVAVVNIDVYVARDGEALIFKVWDSSEDEVLNAPYTVAESVIQGSLGSYPDDLFPIVVTDHLNLTLDLKQGWNQISLNLLPDDVTPGAVFDPVIFDDDTGLQRIVSSRDGSFDPALPNTLNQLSVLKPGEGYWVKMLSDESLELSAPPVNLEENAINLYEGWNHMGYLPSRAGNIREVLNQALESGVIDRITGKEGVFNPDNPDSFNTLSILRPGLGYWVKVTGSDSFHYSEPGVGLTSELSQGDDPFGIPETSTLTPMILYATVKINHGQVESGDVVAAFVGDELRAKSAVILQNWETFAVLTITVVKDNEPLTFKLWDKSENRIIEFPETGVVTQAGGEPYPLDNPLVLDIQAVPFYSLSVTNGSGSGSYTEGTMVDVVADAAPEGQVFDRWTGDVEPVANVTAAATTVTMPDADVSISAVFRTIQLKGDFSKDMQLDLKDVRIPLDILTGSRISLDLEADTDENGKVNLTDTLYILQRLEKASGE